MKASSWPPFDDKTLSPHERELLLNLTVRKLIHNAEQAKAAHLLDDEDVRLLREITKIVHNEKELDLLGRAMGIVRNADVFWSFAKAAAPILAVVILVLSGWDRVVAAASSISGIFK